MTVISTFPSYHAARLTAGAHVRDCVHVAERRWNGRLSTAPAVCQHMFRWHCPRCYVVLEVAGVDLVRMAVNGNGLCVDCRIADRRQQEHDAHHEQLVQMLGVE